MAELDERIADLTPAESLQAAAYVTECLRQKVQASVGAPVTLDDSEASALLGQQFPGAAPAIAAIASDEALRAEAARQLLSTCAADPVYAPFVADALDQLGFKCDPLTIMAVTAGIIFLMQLKFHGKGEIHGKNGKFAFEVGKDPTSEDMLKRIVPGLPTK